MEAVECGGGRDGGGVAPGALVLRPAETGLVVRDTACLVRPGLKFNEFLVDYELKKK